MTRTLWQDKYAIEQTASLTAKPTFAATAIGIEGTGSAGGKFLIPATEHPHLKPSSATQENEMAVGIAQRHHLEYNQTIAEPSTVTIPMLANAYNLSLFIWLLFQSGTSEMDGSGTLKIMSTIPYTDPDPETYVAITRLLGGTAGNSDTVSQYMPGCICNSITLTGETGGLIMLSAELMGANWATANNDLGSISWNTLTFSDKAPLKFQNMTFNMDGNNVNIPNFSITISNNPTPQYYNNTTIQKNVLGKITAEGTFGIPWGDTNEGDNSQITDFQNGTDKFCQFYWGDDGGNADNAVAIQSNLRYTDTEMADAEGEIITNCPFQAIYDGTHDAIRMQAGYDETYLIRGVPTASTTSTTSTTSTS